MSSRSPLSPVQGLARTASIPPPPPRVGPVPHQKPAPGVTASQESATPAPAQRTPATPGRVRKSDEAVTTRAVTLSLPAAIVTRVQERARADRMSQPEVLMDAVTAALENLPQLLESEATHPVSDGIFVRRPPRRSSPDPMATLSMRLLTRNVDAIDALVTRYEASSRSALCAAALREYLKGSSDKEPRSS